MCKAYFLYLYLETAVVTFGLKLEEQLNMKSVFATCGPNSLPYDMLFFFKLRCDFRSVDKHIIQLMTLLQPYVNCLKFPPEIIRKHF